MQPTIESELVGKTVARVERRGLSINIITTDAPREILNPPMHEVWHVPVPGLANEEHTPVGFGAGPN